jgi:hypothetical protein
LTMGSWIASLLAVYRAACVGEVDQAAAVAA